MPVIQGNSTGTQRAPAQVWNLRQNDNDFKTRRRILMSNYTHQTAPTQFVEANGIRFAYRRFGKTGGVPIVFNQHYIGTMDYWDPMVTDGLARDREVIRHHRVPIIHG